MKSSLLFSLIYLAMTSGSTFASEDHSHGPTITLTRWSNGQELYLEHPILTAGQSGRFAVHLTTLKGFQPVREGSVTLRFLEASGTRHGMMANEPTRDGLFTPSVRLPRAGEYQLELVYQLGETSNAFDLGTFVVYESVSAIPSASSSTTEEITFLKEQQWKIPFATATAEIREIKRSVWAVGEVLPSPTAYVEIVAPTDGIVQVGDATDLALPGARVSRGDVVATIFPSLEGSGWTSSQLAYAQAERNYERARRLRDKDAISERDLEEARNEYLALKAGHERLAGSGNGDVLSLTAPIDGTVIDWKVRPGQRLRAGDMLMAVADPSVVWLRVNVYENDFRNLGTPVGAYVGSGGDAWAIPAGDMTVLSKGGALDPATRTVPVLLEIQNASGRLIIHESTPVELAASDGVSAIAVPSTAVLEEEGFDVVYVQSEGESFEKRLVTLGPRHAGWVTVLSGVEAGERVVTEGSYHVKLASNSSEIGHGHSH